jgi:hypothetical protein
MLYPVSDTIKKNSKRKAIFNTRDLLRFTLLKVNNITMCGMYLLYKCGGCPVKQETYTQSVLVHPCDIVALHENVAGVCTSSRCY